MILRVPLTSSGKGNSRGVQYVVDLLVGSTPSVGPALAVPARRPRVCQHYVDQTVHCVLGRGSRNSRHGY